MSSYCTPGIRIQNNIDDPEPQTQETANISNALPSDVSVLTYTQSPSGSGGQKHIKITEAIVYFICKDNQPFSVVDDIGFKKLMKEVAPLYKVPTRNTIKARDPTELCSAALGIFELSKSHSANYISHELLNILNLWDIPKSKILAVVTDNNSTMIKAIKENFGENKHLRCFAHSINLVAEGSMKKVDGLLDLISKVRNIVKFIKISVNCSDELRKLQEKDGDNIKKLILDVVTRWNSVYFMCKRFLELKEVVNQIVLKHINAPPICINDNLSTMLPTSRIGVEFKNAITDEMKKRFEFIEKNYLLSVSTILDPRFKNIHFKDALTLSKHLKFINNSINSISSTVENDHLSTDSSDSTSEYGTIDLWGHHKNLAQKSLKTFVDKTNQGNQRHLGPEITMYLSTPVSPLKTDPLITWEELKPMYPLIHKLATKYLSGVSTSVPS
ncbi:zinc finger BED domain-containing protein 6-like [Melanaphis sacchari]|uniref:zinc finger BED domain-containing protein 6-like n=1 Tax=Melanaphis sacchari TaxID=742174 RepID=UPI000DC13955|nr:zinc finger BED domain-containing protein 6-like [Melanaphis sacchari]